MSLQTTEFYVVCAIGAKDIYIKGTGRKSRSVRRIREVSLPEGRRSPVEGYRSPLTALEECNYIKNSWPEAFVVGVDWEEPVPHGREVTERRWIGQPWQYTQGLVR